MFLKFSAALSGILVLIAGCLGGPEESLRGHATEQPIALFSVAPTSDPLTFEFDASASRGKNLDYHWDFGDGSSGSGQQAKHTYQIGDGVVGVTLTIQDASGQADVALQGLPIGTGANRPPSVTLEVSTDWVATDRPLTAKAAATDPDGDDVDVRIGYAFLGGSAPADLIGGHEAHGHDHGGGSEDYQPEQNGFDSPVIQPGESYTVNLERPGIYVYHCHPHPWMVGTILVGDDPAARSDPVHAIAWSVKTWLPNSLLVRPGTAVTWENPDPTWHTVTLSRFIPLSKLVEPDSEGNVALSFAEEGVHVIAAVATDGKGTSSVAHALVKASRLVPDRVIDIAWNGRIERPFTEPSDNKMLFRFPGNATTDFNWTSVSPAAAGKVRLDVFRETAEGEPVATSYGESVRFPIAPGLYVFQVTNEMAVLAEYEIRLHAELEVRPEFGSAEADQHGGHGH